MSEEILKQTSKNSIYSCQRMGQDYKSIQTQANQTYRTSTYEKAFKPMGRNTSMLLTPPLIDDPYTDSMKQLKRQSGSQLILPKLRINSLRQRMSKAHDINEDNMKLLNRLNSTKLTVPSIEEVRKEEMRNSTLKLRLSTTIKEDPMVKLQKIKIKK